MNTQSPLPPPPAAPPASVLFPLSVPPPEVPVAEASAVETSAGGVRKLSRGEESEETWLPEARDLGHSGINE